MKELFEEEKAMPMLLETLAKGYADEEGCRCAIKAAQNLLTLTLTLTHRHPDSTTIRCDTSASPNLLLSPLSPRASASNSNNIILKLANPPVKHEEVQGVGRARA